MIYFLVSTYMTQDIQAGLLEEITKTNPALNRPAIYTKSSSVIMFLIVQYSRLPTYLTVQFIRFQWKAVERVKAKILKKVKFPMELDVRDVYLIDNSYECR